MTGLRRAVQRLTNDHLLLRSGESLAIVTQGDAGRMADLAWRAATKLGARPLGLRLPAPKLPTNGLPHAALSLLQFVDAFLVFSPSTSGSEQLASVAGQKLRGLHIMSLDHRTVSRVLSLDPRDVADRSRRLADIFSIGKNLEVHTAAGTRLKASVSRVKGRAETGMVREGAEFACVPAGRASVTPVQRSVQGVIMAERLSGRSAPLHEWAPVYVKDGAIAQVRGGEAARPIRNLLRRLDKGERRVVQLSVGTNHSAELGHSCVEDEVVMGCLHVFLGADVCVARGTTGVSLVLTDPTIVIDKHTIIDAGKIVV